MSHSDLGPIPKRISDHKLFPLAVSLAVTAICGGVIWSVVAWLL